MAPTATLDAGKLDDLRTRVRREIDDGHLPSCQFAIAREGELLAFETYGDATDDTRYTIFSSTKAIVASAIWQLLAEGSLSLDDRVVDHVPAFGTNGKDVVTVEQVLLHTSGFPHAPLGPPAWFTRDGRLERFAAWRLNWEPGTRSEYHASSAHWVLAELLEVIDGEDFRDAIHRRVTERLGMPRIVGLPEDEQDGIADLCIVGGPPDPDLMESILGVREVDRGEVTDENLLRFNAVDVRALGVPGGGGITDAATMALFYQHLLRDPEGLWDPVLLADATGNVRNTFVDPVRGSTANRTIGLIVAGDDGEAPRRGFGHTGSPRTFGHNGAGGQVAWADPDSGLSFAYLTNGRDRDPIREGRRVVGLSSRAAVCV